MSNLWIQKGNNILNDGIQGNLFAYEISISSDGSTVGVGAPLNDRDGGRGNGAVRVYELNDSNVWVNKGSALSLPLIVDRSNFGTAIDISSKGNTIVVGAPYNDTEDRGAVYVYEYNDSISDWKIKGTPKTGENYSGFQTTAPNLGQSVAISCDGNCFIVGASNNDKQSGAAYIYQYNDSKSDWDNKGQPLSGFGSSGGFGYSVDMSADGSDVIVGVPGLGRIYSYQYNDSTQQWEEDIVYSGAANELFGWDVSISADGNTVAGGTNMSAIGSGSGSVTILEHNDINDKRHVLKGYIQGNIPNEFFGYSVDLALNGNAISVGTLNNDNDGDVNLGSAYVYTFNTDSNDWVQKGQRLSNDTNELTTVNSVSLSEDSNTLAVGYAASGVLSSLDIYGVGIVYSFDQAPPPCFIAGSMVQTDQGLIKIENVKPGKHTIRSQEIVNSTGISSQNVDGTDYLVRFEKNSLGKGIPNKVTICSPLHMIYKNENFIHAGKLLEKNIAGISKQEYLGEKLYNIQLEEYSHMFVNGMCVETLHPRNIWAKKTISK